jgi:magnesium chelatase subunit D
VSRAAAYPFSALVGQDDMKLALVLNAINPRLGGVLIRGEKGTAKSTAARGLAGLLPPLSVVDGCRFGCDPRTAQCPECVGRTLNAEGALTAVERLAMFVELPLGATEDRVLGTLDLERALQHGERHFEPGLLARANRGILYVDEVNLLPDHLVDALLDAAAMGTNTVEREGVSFSHPAAFVMVGTMNPEEGELRPQLLDRFALTVDVSGKLTLAARAEVVRRRIAYEADPEHFAARWDQAQQAERVRIEAARTLLKEVQLPDPLLDLIARICTEFEVDGLRADIVIYKTAATLAAYAGRTVATSEDVRRAAELALPHRRRRQPFDQPGLDRERLQRIVDEHDDAPGSPAEREDKPGPTDGSNELPDLGQHAQPDRIIEIGEVPRLSVTVTTPPPSRPARATDQAQRRRGASPRVSPRGRHVRSVSFTRAPTSTPSLDVMATLLAAAPHQSQRTRPNGGRIVLERDDLRVKVRRSRVGICTLFVVDASGSMAAKHRMAAAKGAVLSLLMEAYQHRETVGLIAFRGPGAELVLPPTNSTDLAVRRLRDLPTGGRTPLAAALRLAHATSTAVAGGTRAMATLLVVVSDGRANLPLGEGDPHAEVLTMAKQLRAAGVRALVVDTEAGPLRFGLARRLADELGGGYVRLADVPDGAALGAAVRKQTR